MNYRLKPAQSIVAFSILIIGTVLFYEVIKRYSTTDLDKVSDVLNVVIFAFLIVEICFAQYLFRKETSGGRAGVLFLGMPFLIFPICNFFPQPHNLVYVSLAGGIFGCFVYAFLMFGRFQTRKNWELSKISNSETAQLSKRS